MSLNIGEILQNHYRIEQLIGKGGMGAVYRAYHLTRHMQVALKENTFASSEAIRQFECEANLLTHVNHPNLPQVFEYFTLPNGKQYLVMVFIEGETLHDKLHKTRIIEPLSTPHVLGWMLQLCDALNHLHHLSPPVIHRDIKPSNIKVSNDRRAILLDFGIAKTYEVNADTDPGAKRKTPGYCPPEQYDGRTDARSDIYALGATLYHLLTRRLPATSLERLMNNEQWQPPRYWNSEITPEIERIILKAMALKPGDRYQTAYELQQELEPYARTPQECAIEVTKELTAEEYKNLGIVYFNIGQYNQALNYLSQAIQIAPDIAELYATRGTVYTALQRYKEALSDLSKAIQIEPHKTDFYINRGSIYHYIYEIKKALGDYTQAIHLSSDNAIGYYCRGTLYLEGQQYEKAIEDFSQSIHFNPILSEAYNNRGLAYHKFQKYEEALIDYMQAISLSPNNADFYYNRGNTYSILEEYEKALSDYEQALQLHPGFAEVYNSCGEVYRNRGNAYIILQQKERANLQYLKAVQNFTQAIHHNPNLSEAYNNRGCVYFGLEKFQNALIDYTQAINLKPDYSAAYNNRGLIYAELHKDNEALADYRKAIELEPNYANAYWNIGMLFNNRGDLPQALSFFEKAAQLGLPSAVQAVIEIEETLKMGKQSQVNKKKVGRNDPCPCGSGLKYKKCCINR